MGKTEEEVLSKEMIKLEGQIKVLIAKQQMLFSRIQKLYDLSVDLTTRQNLANFKLLYGSLNETREKFALTVDELNLLEIQRDPEYVPNYQSLENVEQMYYKIVEAGKSVFVERKYDKAVESSSIIKPKLPKIELMDFSGDPHQWPIFYETFKSLIHDNEEIDDTCKVQYLISKLKGRALSLCSGIVPIASNYKILWDTLVEKFDDKRLLASTYMKQMLGFKTSQIESLSHINLFLEQFDTAVSALKELKIPDLSDYFIFYLAFSKLDSQSQRDFEVSLENKRAFPTYKVLVKFLQDRSKILSHTSCNSSRSVNKNRNSPGDVGFSRPRQVQTFVNTNESRNVITDKIDRMQCHLCNSGSHHISRCKKFLKSSPDERYKLAKAFNLCLRCLGSTHKIISCKSSKDCSICKSRHNTLLHFLKRDVNKVEDTSPTREVVQTSEADKNDSPTCACATGISKSLNFTTILPTAIIHIRVDNIFHSIRVLLDSASQAHFLTKYCCMRLGLSVSKIRSSVLGIGMSEKPLNGIVKNLKIYSKFNKGIYYTLDAFVVERISSSLPTQPVDISDLSYLEKIPLADDHFATPREIDGIIGAQLFPYIFETDKISGGFNSPIALETTLGYVVMGNAPACQINTHCYSFCSLSENRLDKIVSDFFELENIPKKEEMKPEDIFCEEHYKSTVSRGSEGRYCVVLPFKAEPTSLGDSYNMALQRFLSLENKFEKSTNFREQYNVAFADYLNQGHIRKISDSAKLIGPSYYIPHHAVIKVNSSSTPLRIVFDASAKTESGVSLNDILHTGPKLQNDVLSIFLNFRLFPIAILADLRQMYRQIEMCKDHQRFQRVLYRFSKEDPVEIFEITTVAFGIKSSPYLALRTIKQLVEDESKNFPLASKVITRDMYIDDLVTSIENEETAKLLLDDLVGCFGAGGFTLTKWCTNSQMLLDYINESCSDTQKVALESEFFKVLGIQWHPKRDIFIFKINNQNLTCSKRNVLSIVARFFDPVGFIAPVILFAKLFIKELWCLKLSWDETPPDPVIEKWNHFLYELSLLESFNIPRYLGVTNESRVILVGFADACETSFAALVYVCIERNEGLETHFLTAKSRVSPMQTLSIPRLELNAALLLSKLLKFVVETFSHRIVINRIFAFTDSTVVLHWISSASYQWKTYVANRVAKIHDCFPPEIWYHVAGENNASDKLSRGQLPSAFITSSHEWLTGPAWLQRKPEFWPVKPINEIQSNEKIELKQTCSFMTQENSTCPIYDCIVRQSSWSKLLKIMVYVLKFTRLVARSANISVGDLHRSEVVIMKAVQREHFYHEICNLKLNRECSKNIRKLRPFLDKDGIIRVGGRLSNANISFEEQHPILLPKKDHLVDLLIDNIHQRYFHTGPHLVSTILRQNYWIISARTAVRSRLRSCNFCFKFKPKPLHPLMADLPSARVNSQIKPFIHTGLDYTGPFFIALSRYRGVRKQKAYICIFICMSTKAIHLELVSNLSTDCFIDAFKRFLSRRGPITTLYSDRGTNFVGAKAKLDDFYNFIESSDYVDTFKEILLSNKIQWKFNPPSAPHMGGLWEGNIKSLKTHLNKVLFQQLLTYEEFSTILAQIEALLNSRPLCWLSSDPSDPQPLTPAHFLTLTPLNSVPFDDTLEISRLNRKKLIDSLTLSFWKRWQTEYLRELQVRQKWNTDSNPIRVGTVVIVCQDNSPSYHWPLGIITEIYPGKDGIVRTARVKTKTGLYLRPVVKLCPLPNQ